MSKYRLYLLSMIAHCTSKNKNIIKCPIRFVLKN